MGVNSGLADVLADVCVQPKRSFYNDGCGLCMQKCKFVGMQRINAKGKQERQAADCMVIEEGFFGLRTWETNFMLSE